MTKKLTNNNSLFILSLSLFFTWGFITLLNDILIPVLKSEMSLDYSEAMLVQFVFFATYGVMSIPMAKLLDKLSYRISITFGLIIIACGCVILIVAHATLLYIFILAGLFVLATGIVMLQVAANLLVTLLGEKDTSSSRLTLAQGINSLGYVIAPLLISAASVNSKNLSIVYSLIAVVMIVFSIIFIKSNISVLTDNELEEVNTSDSKDNLFIIFFGVISIFVYVGAEVSAGSLVVSFLNLPSIANFTITKGTGYLAFYWGGAMIGRFIGSWLLLKFESRKVLFLFALINTLLVISVITSTGHIAMWSLLSMGLFNSVMFPTIYAITLREIKNQHLKQKVSGLLITAIIGGAIVPLIQGKLADLISLQNSFILLIFCYILIAVFSISHLKIFPQKKKV